MTSFNVGILQAIFVVGLTGGLAFAQVPENDIEPIIKQIKDLGGKQLVENGAKASYSRDGKQIVYSEMPFGAGIKLLNLKTGETTTVVESGKDPAFSPGKTPLIAYVRGDGLGEEVWLVQPDGKQDRKVGEGGFPTWSKDGKTLYFHSRKRRIVLSVDPTAEEPKPLELKIIPSWYPAVSPDGQSVATVYPAAFVLEDLQMGRDIVHRLPGFTRGGLAGWSADGTQVGYGGFGYDDRVGLWIYDVQDGKSKKILDGPCTMPAWSPDGSKLIFDFRPHRNRHEVWMIETKSLEKGK
jgi:Tol biopolymer transport system component